MTGIQRVLVTKLWNEWDKKTETFHFVASRSRIAFVCVISQIDRIVITVVAFSRLFGRCTIVTFLIVLIWGTCRQVLGPRSHGANTHIVLSFTKAIFMHRTTTTARLVEENLHFFSCRLFVSLVRIADFVYIFAPHNPNIFVSRVLIVTHNQPVTIFLFTITVQETVRPKKKTYLQIDSNRHL